MEINMKRLGLLLVISAACALAQAGAGRTVLLTWTDPTNPAATTYSVYRAEGGCVAASPFVRVATGITAKTHDDVLPEPGNYCYRVTANYKGLESAPSNSAAVTVPLAAPAALSVIVK
jgi:hypothetical protein